jgi:hypothetical protein
LSSFLLLFLPSPLRCSLSPHLSCPKVYAHRPWAWWPEQIVPQGALEPSLSFVTMVFPGSTNSETQPGWELKACDTGVCRPLHTLKLTPKRLLCRK